MEQWNPPLHCLVPTDVARAITKLLKGGEKYGAMRVWSRAEAPNLSDRVVAFSGSTEQLENDCQVVLSLLRQSQNVRTADGALFVLLVPALATPMLIGTTGQRLPVLSQQTGAKISISRDIIEGLQMQSVTLMGTLDEVLAGTLGVQRVLMEYVQSGEMPPGNFSDFGCWALPRDDLQHWDCRAPAPVNFSDFGCWAPPKDDLQHWECRAPAPILLLVDMDAAAWICGKQGKTVEKLKKSTGALIQVRLHTPDNKRSSKCGDRIVQIFARDVVRQDSAVRAIFNVVEEHLRASADGARDRDDIISLLIPPRAVSRIIGPQGQTINSIRHQLGVHIRFDDFGPLVAGRKKTIITGPHLARVEAVRLLSSKVDELHDTAPARAPLMAGIHASGVMSNQLTMQVPRDVIDRVDLLELERRTGVTIMVNRAMIDDAESKNCYVTVVGQRLCTSMAILYLQQMLVEAGYHHYSH